MFEVRPVGETGSTNDDAAKLLGEPDSAGLVLVADYQSAGHGRRARSWVAPRGSALLFTAILPGSLPARALWALPFWTALGVADGIERTTGLRVTLQWPNDLLLEGRKCCGILCISRVAGSEAWAGCGVGINVARPADDPELARIEPPPAFLSDFALDVPRERLLAEILSAFERRWPELADPAAVARAWEERAGLAGTPYRILIDGSTEPIEAVALRLDEDGALVVAEGHAIRSIALGDARVMR
jgi:BirA family transcriptional regulator, biotin operon repressor / biotin---[acetyl-CoA-carboxylase] ligase